MTEKRSMDKDSHVFNASVVVVDIEGTTTSINFVKETLFPYVRENLDDYINTKWAEEEVKDVVSLLREQAVKDSEDKLDGAVDIPVGDSKDVKDSVMKNVLWQMDNDRKTKALKKLQGQIWRNGYSSGKIVGHLYDDVKECLKMWSEAGKNIYVYSSGSVEAQKLLFGHSKDGDLLPYFSGYFDTEVGPKTDSSSYEKIFESVKENGHVVSAAKDILFLTDMPKEAQAASEVGIQAVLVVREGNTPLSDDVKEKFSTITSFSDITFEGNIKRRKLSHETESVETKENGCDDKIVKDMKDVNDQPMEVCSNDNSDSGCVVNSNTANDTVPDTASVNSEPVKQSKPVIVNDDEKSTEIVSESNLKDDGKANDTNEKKELASDITSSQDVQQLEGSVPKKDNIANEKDSSNECSSPSVDVKESSGQDEKVIVSGDDGTNVPDSTVDSDDVEMKEPEVKKSESNEVIAGNETIIKETESNNVDEEMKSLECEKVSKEAVVNDTDKTAPKESDKSPDEANAISKNGCLREDSNNIDASEVKENVNEVAENQMTDSEVESSTKTEANADNEDLKVEKDNCDKNSNNQKEITEKSINDKSTDVSQNIINGVEIDGKKEIKDTESNDSSKCDIKITEKDECKAETKSKEESTPDVKNESKLETSDVEMKENCLEQGTKPAVVNDLIKKDVTDADNGNQISDEKITEKDKLSEKQQNGEASVAEKCSDKIVCEDKVDNDKEEKVAEEVTEKVSDKKVDSADNKLVKSQTDISSVSKTDEKLLKDEEKINSEASNKEEIANKNEETDDIKTDSNSITSNGTHKTSENGITDKTNLCKDIPLKEKKLDTPENVSEENGIPATGKA